MPDKNITGLPLLARPLYRTMLSALVAAVAVLLFSPHHSMLLLFQLAWIVFSASYLSISWAIIGTRTIDHIRQYARSDDGSGAYVFGMVILSAFASMLIVLLLLISKSSGEDQALLVFVSVAGILLSWTMVHTIYTFHYAHMYYNNASEKDEKDREGLEFPGDEPPGYLDFAYFSFVIGCTFQVSDVEISSKHIRKSVLLHGIFSFLLNTFVVALTINLMAGLKK